MAGLDVSKWQAARKRAFYDPAMQFYLRMIRTALDEAKVVMKTPCPYGGGEYEIGWLVNVWDRAVMARDWIARETPDRKTDYCGYVLSFEHACYVLGLDADREATWMLRVIDECADFDTDEVHARIAYLTDNPPDEVEEEEFEAFRVVPRLDQGFMFGPMGAM